MTTASPGCAALKRFFLPRSSEHRSHKGELVWDVAQAAYYRHDVRVLGCASIWNIDNSIFEVQEDNLRWITGRINSAQRRGAGPDW